MEFTETGKLIYDRTYSRIKSDGSKETWEETVSRVVDGNLSFVDERHHFPGERELLRDFILQHRIIPAGRHLWASGVKNSPCIFNCWVSHWTDAPADHFTFTFLRLMEGGGVGANYSNRYLENYPEIQQELSVQIVCDPTHPDYESMQKAGVLSDQYAADWAGAWEVEDSREGWAAALADLVETFYRPDVKHRYRVYDVSRVRPSGARLKTFGGTASGPEPLARMLIRVAEILSDRQGARLDGIGAMEIDHALAECVVSGGVRRSARMAMMHWRDPQIVQFIRAKTDTGLHWTTNISVEVDSDFWHFLELDGAPEGSYNDRMHRHAKAVLGEIADGMVNNGEPGFWDSSLSNINEPNTVVCTNPCGEITLEPWEPCNLGHINLAAFVDERGILDRFALAEAHRLMTRFLIRATFAPVNDPKAREVLDRNRRIGVGHFGVASMLAMTGRRYSDASDDQWFLELLGTMADVVDGEARRYARQLRIPEPVKKRTVAPTGTIAKMPGVSEGIHPIFARYFIRRVRFSTVDADQRAQMAELVRQGYAVEDDQYAANTAVVSIPTKDILVEAVDRIHGEGRADEIVQGTDELTLREMLDMQATYQTWWADNAVSYTANVDPEAYTAEEVAEVLEDFGGWLKGATIFPKKSRPQAPYEAMTREEYEASTVAAVADGVDEECANGACPIR